MYMDVVRFYLDECMCMTIGIVFSHVDNFSY